MAVYKKKLKKIPRYFSLGSLTVGASLILGFLSFGGMYALYPAIYLAFAAFGLSVAYEGEIYLQNIKGAFKKLFKKDYLENHLAKEYLLEHFPADTQSKECPQFFRDYETQLKLLEEFNHKSLNKVSRKRKKQIEKTLGDMEKWFALQVFMTKESKKPSAYTAELREWLKHHEQKEWQARLENRQSTFKYVKGFSILAATFMGLGSTYLIVEAFSVIPLIAAIPFALWPIFIVPMSVVAGAAYGMLIYNTITDLINNDTINKWYTRLRNDLSQGLTARNMLMTALAVFLVSLAITLTVCTAGTWWTVATSARPLFEWMKKMPSFVMGVINPIITGLSAIFFNVENSASSFGMVYEAMTPDKDINTKRNVFQRTYREIADVLTHVWDTENWLQMLNPFRILLKLTVTPLRILLFLGHLVSVALTSDRMPGVPKIVSALVAIICEGFEDAHYFMGLNAKIKTLLEERLDSEEDHQDADIPTFLLKVLASPLYFLAAAWDCLASKMNPSTAGDSQIPQPKALTLTQAWNKQLSIPDEVEVVLSEQAKRPSKEWQKEHTLSLIEKYEKKHFDSIWFGDQIADHKKDELQKLKREIRQTDGSALGGILEAAKKNAVFNQHRLFAIREDEPTATQEFIAELPERVNAL